MPLVNALPLRFVDSEETALPLLVFVHGWPDSTALWKSQVAHFRGRYRTVCVDLPGFGADRGARGADFPELADRLAATIRAVTAVGRPSEVVLVGHDWGAYLSYEFERRHAALIDRFVTLDVGAHLRPESFGHFLFLVSYQWWLVAAHFLGCDAMVRPLARAFRAPEAERAEAAMGYPYRNFWRARLRRKYRDRLIARYRPSRPLLYLYGAKNPYPFHSKRWEKVVRESPRSEVVAIDGAHWFPLRCPEATNTAIDRWLSRC